MMATTPDESETLIADLGFLLRWDLPRDDHDALLVIALREEPTERHFDPERIRYWRTDEFGRGRRAELTYETPMPLVHDCSWGEIQIVDRFDVRNTWYWAGGRLSARRTEDGTVIATFVSPGPILARGGHSQGYDRLAAAMTAFFARLRAPVALRPGAEARLAHARPIQRYAAFLRHDLAHIRSSDLVRDAYGEEARLVAAEAARMERHHPTAWADGERLLRDLGLAPPLRAAG